MAVPPTGRPATASGVRASRLQSRRCHGRLPSRSTYARAGSASPASASTCSECTRCAVGWVASKCRVSGDDAPTTMQGCCAHAASAPQQPQQPRACAPRQVARADGNGTKKHTTMMAPATATLVPPARSTRATMPGRGDGSAPSARPPARPPPRRAQAMPTYYICICISYICIHMHTSHACAAWSTAQAA